MLRNEILIEHFVFVVIKFYTTDNSFVYQQIENGSICSAGSTAKSVPTHGLLRRIHQNRTLLKQLFKHIR